MCQTWLCLHQLDLTLCVIKIQIFVTVLTDIDINSYDSSSIEVPSINSYRMTQDVMCVKPSSHRGGMGSFRSTRDTVRSTNSNVPNGKNERPVLMYRGNKINRIIETIIIYSLCNFQNVHTAIFKEMNEDFGEDHLKKLENYIK